MTQLSGNAGNGHEGEWCERLAARLADSPGESGGLLLTPRLQAAILRLARDVAHRTERKNAPLAAFIAGRHVQARVATGIDAEAALREVVELAAELLPDSDQTGI